MKAAADAILRPEQAAYLEALEPPRDALLVKMEARAAERGYPVSDPEVASFLAVTAQARRPRLVVELGTNIGYGAIVLARAAGPEAKVLTFELSHDLCETAREFIAEAGLQDRITVLQGAALHELEKLEEPIDLAYIDCVKEEYPRYLDLLVPRLAPDGVVVADNVLWGGHVARSSVPDAQRAPTEALRAFNLALVQHPSLRAVILPLGDGVAYAVKQG
ncbi:O-methyltransferase [Pendulispora rubella]|uniref:O-methyltransferase n=1 Tax=Pendulispora rubella TaxID=2741070 RepID=A0ABZ2LB92_9BACT